MIEEINKENKKEEPIKAEDKTLFILGIVAAGMLILLLMTGCISKIPCNEVNLKDISLCASVEYQDRIANLCNEKQALIDEVNNLRINNGNNQEILTEYREGSVELLDEIDILEKLLTDCNDKRDKDIADLEIKLKKLINKANLLDEQFKGKNEAIKRKDKEIEKLEKNTGK